MKAFKLLIALLLFGAAGLGSAWADRGHWHYGVMIGPYWGPWHYPPRAYYYPPDYPLIIERQAPQVYIEQQPTATGIPAPPAAEAGQADYWYYCAAPKGYYPYVKECPDGWQKVLPQPPGQL